MRVKRSDFRRARGFSLVEMMIALVLGLVVSGAALALTVSIIRANNEMVVATRLTQELRALLGVVGREVSRARYMADPLSNIGAAAARMNANDLVVQPGAGCIRFSYYDPDPDRNLGTADGGNVAVGFALRDGALFGHRSNPFPIATNPVPLPTCDEVVTRLSSQRLNITAFRTEILDDERTVDTDADGDIDQNDQLDPGNEAALLALEIQAALVGDTSGLAISRVVRERMRIGSARLPPPPPPAP